MQSARMVIKIVISCMFILVCCTGILYADKNTDEPSQTSQSSEVTTPLIGLLYNGTVQPEGSVSVHSESGKSYTIQGNTPIGLLYSLQQDDKISGYTLGDELMQSRGILLINDINGHRFGNESGWYVKVNGQRLEDVVVSDVMGLNLYPLKEGDVVIFALGNPEGMVSDSIAYLTATVGSIQKASVVSEERNVSQSDSNNVNGSDITAASSALINETAEETITGSQGQENDEQSGNESSETTENTTTRSNSELFEGTLSLPTGSVNITTTGGDYDINADTPLGLLQKLLDENDISSLTVNDRTMKKGGILVLEGINDYSFSGDKTWFVTVNGVVLQDYNNPHTDGLNLYTLKKGDEVGYYFGEPTKPVSDATASILITLE